MSTRAWIGISPPYLLRYISLNHNLLHGLKHLIASIAQQSTMIRRLEHTFGITDHALTWMISYLSARSFYVRWGNTSSSKLHVNTGVPRGSSLGPLCFSSYVAPLSRVLSSFGVRHLTPSLISMQRHTNLHLGIQVRQICQTKWVFSNNAPSLRHGC